MILFKRDRKIAVNRIILSVFMGLCSYFIFMDVGQPIYLNDFLNYKLVWKSNFVGMAGAGYTVVADIVGSLFVLVLFVVLANSLPYILVFAIEKPVFIREYSNGLYSIFPYYFVKIVSDFPINLITPLVQLPFSFYSVPYGLVPCYGRSNIVVTSALPENCPLEDPGQINQGKVFGYMYIALVLAAMNGLSWSLLIGAYAPYLSSATVIGQVVIIPMILFCGILCNIKLMPKFVRPL